MNTIVKTIGLTKTLGGREVVSGVNMTVRKGEIYGFLGPNGAGKTTIMKMLMNLVKPSAGCIELFQEPLTPSSYEVYRRVGSLIEIPVFYEKLTARQNLRLHLEYMGYHDERAVDEALSRVSLHSLEDQAVKTFSLGMKQRLAIARAIITRPELLILDEPINGLDPAGIKEMRSLLQLLSANYGMTILLSSHLLGEMEQLADTIGVISGGRLIQEVPMEKIREQNAEYIELVTPDQPRACAVLADELELFNFKVIGENIIRIFEPGITQTSISKTLAMNEVEVESLSRKYTSLEQYFLNLIQENEVRVP